jgi:hypothetical protein
MVEELLFKLGWSGFSLIFVVVGLSLMNAGRKRRARSERIADTGTTKIRDLQPGTVQVRGTAHPAEDATVMESPITHTDALVSRVEVEEYDSGGEGGGHWDTIHEDETAVSMIVDDATGEVRVELPPDGGSNLEQIRTRVGSGDEPPEPVRRYVESEADLDEATRHDLGLLSVGDRRRYSEGAIEPGEEIDVLGRAREERAGWGERDYVIDEPTESGDFVLSDRSEEELVQEGKLSGLLLLAFGGVFAGAGTLFTVFPWLAL